MRTITSNFAKTVFSAAAVTFLTLAGAMAGPEGTYSVEGTSPGSGSTYSGSVNVERTGDTYQVVWNIGDAVHIGSGLGAAPTKRGTIIGPADDADFVLAVSYLSGPESFGLAYYIEQEDGTWKGIWTYGGSESIGTETWIPE